MRFRKLVLAGGVAGSLLAAAPGSASANIMWCVGDPPAQLTTSTGTRIVVNTYVYADGPHRKLAAQTTVDATSAPDGAGGTLITLVVHAPAGQVVTVVASVQRGEGDLSAQASGSGDFTMVLDVPIA